jgi:hypothetical protein
MPGDLLFFAGPILDAIALKAYKAEWASDRQAPLTARSRIFFSVWITDKSPWENKLFYNIHALKLRELAGYRIAARDFATRFRTRFKPEQPQWPNVSVNFGPLTLMQGWQPLNPATIRADIVRLVRQFTSISPLIDQVLQQYKR